MVLLLAGRLAPITSEIGFLEAPSESVAAAFASWHDAVAPPGVRYACRRPRAQSLEALLRQLCPLVTVERTKYLFLPTQSERWTAYFDNGANGGDPATVMSVLAERMGCNGVRVCVQQDTIEKGGAFGATIFELYGPAQTNFLNHVRGISVANDGGRWTFDTNGEVQPFERTDQYQARRIRDRFTPAMLGEYCAAMGIVVFAESFYRVEGAVVVERQGPLPDGVEEFDLETARERLGLAGTQRRSP